MAKGFIFNSNLCVNCRSCSAGCMLENGFSHPVRRIFVHNPDAYLPEPVINISMACNHCGETPCITGCPASALQKDPVTGAVIVDDTKCIGCRFCIWNCPWDAPKFNETTGTIEKCTFCTHLLEEGRAPACTNACPTMALRFGEIVQTENDEAAVILPAVDINPSAEIRVKGNSLPETIPARNEIIAWETEGKSLSDDVEWSLLVFSFLSVISVSLAIHGSSAGIKLSGIIALVLLICGALTSLLHLGRYARAWRSASNILRSPVSREIISMILYGLSLVSALIFPGTLTSAFVTITGLLFLFAIDGIYFFTRVEKGGIHSGQALFSGIMVISFLQSSILPFVFIALVRLVISAASIRKSEFNKTVFPVRFIRMAVLFLLIVSSLVIPGDIGTGVTVILLAGEFIDRYLFYLDFNPLSFSKTIHNTIKY